VLRSLVIGLGYGSAYALLALGIVMVYKGSRVLNFAQGEIGTASLFVAWEVSVQWKLPWLVGAAAAIAVAGLLGLAFERLVVRQMGDSPRLSVAVATIALLTFLIFGESILFSPDPRVLPPPVHGLGVRVAGFYVSPTQLISFAVVALLGLGLAAFLRLTDFGLGIQATAEDANAARLSGVRTGRVSAFTWAAACGIAAIAALLIEPTLGLFAPGSISNLFVGGLAAALVGGITSLPGAFVGGLAVGVIEAESVHILRATDLGHALGTTSLAGIDSMTLFTVIVLVLLFRPGGVLAARQVREA
jgi:branched-subunit amino acid ABC-type transport system permease component